MDNADEIRNLIYRYGELVGQGRFDEMALLFEHATFDVSEVLGVVWHGADDVRNAYSTGVKVFDDGRPRTMGVATNIIIEFNDDETRAATRSRWFAWQAVPEIDFPLQMCLIGRYHDQFEKVNDVWRFIYRKAFVDWVGDQSAHMNPVAGRFEFIDDLASQTSSRTQAQS